MYILYFLFNLLIMTECKWYKQINGYHKPTKHRYSLEASEVIIEKIAQHLKVADNIVTEKCNDLNNVRESYEPEGYILKYSLKGELEEFVRIKILNNVLSVKAKLEDGTEFRDVKILQPNVETRDAIWWIEGEDLIITMPYKVKIGLDIQLQCEDTDREIDVPLSPEYSVYHFLNVNIQGKPDVSYI